MSNDNTGDSTSRFGIGLTTAAALGGVVFGDFAQELAQWLVCAHSAYIGEPCKGTPKTQALAIGTFVSTVVAIFVTASAALTAKKSHQEAVAAVAAALLGCLFALLKTSVSDKGYPDIEPLSTALFVYVSLVLIFAVPLIWGLKPNQESSRFAKPLLRWSSALLMAFAAASVVQGLAELAWQGTVDRTSSRKFVLPPMAALPATAILSILVLKSVTSDNRYGRWTAVGIAALAVLLAIVHVLFDYYPQHGRNTGWMTAIGIEQWQVVALFIFLTIPVMLTFLAYGHFFGSDIALPKALLLTGPAVCCVATAAFVAGRWRIAAGVQDSHDLLVFVIAHGSVPIFVTLVVWASYKLTLWHG